MADASSWLETLSALREARTPCAMVVVTGVRGSVPREVGARMIVAEGRLAWGTIGGGNLERLAIEHATALARESGHGEHHSESVAFPLSEKAGQCCGGEVTLFFESFPWTRPQIVIFGAGHVAQALAGLAPWMSADVRLIDPREEAEIQPPLPRERPWDLLLVDAPEQEIDALPPETLVLVMTHSHDLDLEIIARALAREPFAYLGLIGSERKWARFKKRLEQRGFRPDQMERVQCPIGATRASKEPGAIALVAAAELISVLAGTATPRTER